LPFNEILCRVAKTVASKSISVAVGLLFAVAIAFRRLTNPVLGGNMPSIVVFTTIVLRSTRLSSGSID